MVTTIQLREDVKNDLDRLKSGRETYEAVILRLMKHAERNGVEQEQLIIEGCKAISEESLKITREFESIENLHNWKW